jgi:hypothetical protein
VTSHQPGCTTGRDRATVTHVLPAGGRRVPRRDLHRAPASTPPAEGIDVRAALADPEAALPGLFDHNEPDNPGMHTTVTIDFEYVLSGRVVVELDDGATVELERPASGRVDQFIASLYLA